MDTKDTKEISENHRVRRVLCDRRRLSVARFQAGDRRTEMRRGVVPELLHERVMVEGRLDDASLHAASAAMHQPHFLEPGDGGGIHIFFNDRRNIARRERVQVDLRLDWNNVRDHINLIIWLFNHLVIWGDV